MIIPKNAKYFIIWKSGFNLNNFEELDQPSIIFYNKHGEALMPDFPDESYGTWQEFHSAIKNKSLYLFCGHIINLTPLVKKLYLT